MICVAAGESERRANECIIICKVVSCSPGPSGNSRNRPRSIASCAWKGVVIQIPSLRSAMLRFRQMKALQKFASVHASFHNHFNSERHLVSRNIYKARRSAAIAEWQNRAA